MQTASSAQCFIRLWLQCPQVLNAARNDCNTAKTENHLTTPITANYTKKTKTLRLRLTSPLNNRILICNHHVHSNTHTFGQTRCFSKNLNIDKHVRTQLAPSDHWSVKMRFQWSQTKINWTKTAHYVHVQISALRQQTLQCGYGLSIDLDQNSVCGDQTVGHPLTANNIKCFQFSQQ